MMWKTAFASRQELVLVTVTPDHLPHAIYALSMGIEDGFLIIGVCLMKTTLVNLRSNPNAVVVGKSSDGYFRISGTAKIYSAGKYLETAIKNSNPPMPTQALLMTINTVVDLNTGNQIPLSE